MRELNIRKSDEKTNTMQKEIAITAKPRNILESFEHIVVLAEDSNLYTDFFEKADRLIMYASR